tara:strand:- start:76 stop:279 length:204 start_codon:yes stop_codon:yes gene_type:complete
MIKPIALAIAVLTAFLAGCADGPDWHKPAATDADRHQAIADCRLMANQADEDDIFGDCMKGKGFVED